MHEWAVAERAPGRDASGSAPIDLASTTAKAEFCIPVSMDIVLQVFVEYPNNSRGMKKPTKNPSECSDTTDVNKRRSNAESIPAVAF